jgi:ABC-2 type transport system permease protein
MTVVALGDLKRTRPSIGSQVRLYTALARAAFRTMISFPVGLIFGTLANVMVLLTTLYLWRAILSHGSHMGGWTWPAMRSYLVVTFVAGSLVGMSSDYRGAVRILEGDIAIDMARPADYQLVRLAESSGLAVVEATIAIVVGVSVVELFGGLQLPSGGRAVLFAASMLAVFPLKWASAYVANLACFWTHNYMGVSWARQAIIALLSGAMIPLALLPAWLRVPAEWMPFQGMASTPGLVFTGRIRGTTMVGDVALQYGWAVVAFVVTRALWTRASRQLTVHGG